MDAWEKSDEFLKQIEEANKYSTIYYERATGLETWFTLPDLKTIVAPPKWKMAIVSLLAAYCISTLSNYILSPFLGPWPLLASSIIINVILVVSLTYFAMPILSRLLQRWLYPSNV